MIVHEEADMWSGEMRIHDECGVFPIDCQLILLILIYEGSTIEKKSKQLVMTFIYGVLFADFINTICVLDVQQCPADDQHAFIVANNLHYHERIKWKIHALSFKCLKQINVYHMHVNMGPCLLYK